MTIVLLILLVLTPASRCGDPYAAALDNRFEPASPAKGPEPGVATFEEGLKNQIREMSHRVEPVAPAPVPESEPWLVLASIMVAALMLSLIGILSIRQWNQWLDREAAKRLSTLANDPLMSEFLRALKEDPQASPDQIGHSEPSSAEAELKDTPTAANALASDPVAEATTLVREIIEAFRGDFQKLSRASDNANRQKILQEVLGRVEKMKDLAAPATLRPVRLLASALHGLLNQLSLKAANVTSSSVRTALAAVDLIDVLCARMPRADLVTVPPVRFLAVDDDAISRRAVSLSLKKAFNDPDLAPDARIGLALARQQAYDVIFLDVEMPVMDGFELYSKIRETAPNCSTPIVFVTSHTDFDSRAKSALLGANELIGKPFLAFEITVKALTLVIKTRHAQELADASKQNRGGGDSVLLANSRDALNQRSRQSQPSDRQTLVPSSRA